MMSSRQQLHLQEMISKFWIVTVTLYFIHFKASAESNICENVGIVFDEAHNHSVVTKVRENEGVFIPCQFEYRPGIINNQDPRPVPFWRVQNRGEERPRFYYPGRLPINFNYNESLGGLTISKVERSASVSCCFEFFDASDICEASPVYIVVEREPNSVITTHVHSSARPTLSGTRLVSSILVIIAVTNLLIT